MAASVKAAETKNHLMALWCRRMVREVLYIFQNPEDRSVLFSGTFWEAGLGRNRNVQAYPKNILHIKNTTVWDNVAELNWSFRFIRDSTPIMTTRNPTLPELTSDHDRLVHYTAEN